MINTTPVQSESFVSRPSPTADHDPVGRHGTVIPAETPVLPNSEADDIRKKVEGLYADFDAWEARILATIGTRTGKMAVVDTVSAPSVVARHDHAA